MKLISISAVAAIWSIFFVPVAAQAQNVPAADSAKSAIPHDDGLNEIVVSGSRIVRDGFKSPTPTSVLGIEEIQSNAPRNIADFVNQLPSLAGSDTPTVTTGSVSAGRAGINSLDLRGLGGNRVLVLLDGQRVPSSLSTGVVDLNTLPQSLISRVDVVTGGASAAWGSDAVAGVVNFTLDRKFTGLKATVQGNTTTYGDDRGYNISLTGGTGFASGRGHVILSGEIAHSDGIKGLPRDWYNGRKTLYNPAYTPTNGQPQLITRDNSGYSVATPGLIFTTGPLRGTYFGPGGVPGQLNYGSLVRDPGFVGGDWSYADFGRVGDLDSKISRQSIFGLASYDVTDKVQVFAEASYGVSDNSSAAVSQFNLGNLTIRPDNAFLPADLAAILAADGKPTYKAGSLNGDLPPLTSTNRREMKRFVVGANGGFGVGGTNWTWKAYLQTSRTDIRNEALTTITAKYKNAIDAVRNAVGRIVCRVNAVTITDPACVPYDIFGTGTASEPAKNYVLGTGWLQTQLQQDVAAASIQGEPFSSWAGPVSVAAGLEHRRESVDGSNDALSDTNAYFAGNYHATIGSYNVTEGFLETLVPLAAEQAWAKKLDLNAAVRETRYSTSGSVTTWKMGLTYSPIEDITFRVTRSRDIRAPSLSELFAPGGAGTSTLLDPFRGNASTSIITLTSGNPNLQPEKADTTGVGLVFQPRFLPGFTASVDYYKIDINGAIGALDAPTIVNGCFAGITAYCGSIQRDANGNISEVNVTSFNANAQKARGVDFEASYRKSLESIGGNLTLRLFATRFLENSISFANPKAIGYDLAGENDYRGPPKYRYLASIGYDNGPASVSLTGRGISAGVISNKYLQCTSGCPTSTNALTTIDDNHIAGAFYLDASVSYQLKDTTTVFLTVANLLNKDPASDPASQNIGNSPKSINAVMYDVLGRTFRAGVRFRMR